MRTYHQLTLEEREKLYGMQQKGMTLRAIAKKLNRSHTSLSRELRRNIPGEGKRSHEYFSARYVPCRAQKKAEKRKAKQRYKAPLKEPFIFL